MNNFWLMFKKSKKSPLSVADIKTAREIEKRYKVQMFTWVPLERKDK